MKKFVGAVFLLSTVMTHQAVGCDMGAIEAWVASICDDNGCTTEPTIQPPAPAKVGSTICNFLGGYHRVEATIAACRPAQLRTASDGPTCDGAQCRWSSLSCGHAPRSRGG
jgi:hypothetical protein